jgi:L-lysine exporter family protein LysE/ArgO
MDFLQGMGLGLSLIVAIGAQNAFVLRQGLRGEHLGAVVAICALCDALLINAGVFGSRWLQTQLPGLEPVLRWGGAAFLTGYGLLALRRAWRPGGQGLSAADAPPVARAAVLAQTFAFTLLNPHVYLDTVILLGSVGAQQGSPAAFAAGASLGSLLWFVSLGYAARRLAPWLRKPAVWRGIDALMGLLMLGLAAGLIA